MGKRLNCYASGETARECEKIKRRHERNKRKARAKSLANDPKPVWYPFDGNSAVEYHKYLDALTVWERRHPEGDAEPGPKKFEPQKPEPVVAAPPVVAPVAKIITPMPNITLRPAPRVPVREPRKRVGMCCSNPSCLKPTSGPRVDPNKSLNVGFAAHITAASEGGCRYDLSLTSEQRQDIENGIWLCRTCAKLIDSDETRYTVHVLREWKRSAEESAHADVETDYSPRNQVSNEDNDMRASSATPSDFSATSFLDSSWELRARLAWVGLLETRTDWFSLN